jgi:hypothetical protein
MGPLHASNRENEPNNNKDAPIKNQRKIVRYDNVGDPVYEGDEFTSSSGSGINVLGLNIDVDPLTLSLLIFGAIAFNFFVLANL